MVSDRRRHLGSFRELNGILIALMPRVSFGQLSSDAIKRVFTPSLVIPDGVARNPDVVSTFCKQLFKPSLCKVAILSRSRKSPTAVLFDVDIGRISIRQCEMLKSTTLNVLGRSQ
ncbi:hypothetical protein Tco_0612176 [Tanacetum coccineum]